MVCLTFDTDHMNEARMCQFLEQVPFPGAATFFCVERHACLDGSGHETGPHPFLGDGSDWSQVLKRARADFPEATGCRPHSCTWSHMLSVELGRSGFEYVSAWDQVGRTDLRPYRERWGVWHMPIYYMDTLDISMSTFWDDAAEAPFDPALIEAAVGGDGLFVFAFHPVHILLNSSSPAAYMERRDAFLDGVELAELRCAEFGVGDYFRSLCDSLSRGGQSSRTLSAALAAMSVVPTGSGSP